MIPYGYVRISETLNNRQSHEEEVVMKVVTLKEIPNTPMEGAERIEGYTGPVSRSRQRVTDRARAVLRPYLGRFPPEEWRSECLGLVKISMIAPQGLA